MALKLNKLFVRVPGDVTVVDISAVSVQEDNQKKLYFLENLHQIVNNGIAYGVDPNTVQSITDLQQLIGKSAKDQNENTIIERLSALEAIKVLDPSYVSIDTSANADGTNTPVINLNIVDITSNDHGLVDNKNAKGYIDAEVAKATTVVEAGKGIDVDVSTADDGHKIYTIDSSLNLTYTPATSGQSATINLVDKDGTYVFGQVNVSDIIGNGVIDHTDYEASTGILTLTFKQADGTTQDVEIDLHKMLDIGDVMVHADSSNYLEISTVDSSNPDSSQATFKTLMQDVSTADATHTGLVDAYNVQQFIKAQTTDLHVDVASKNDYIDASVDAENNKKVNIEANVQDLTASEGTRGTYSVAADGTVSLSGETAPTLIGVADSLTDGDDVATKVKTYVDAKVAAEAARTDANIEGAVKALDAEVTSSDGTNVTVKVTEVDGIITAVNVTDTYATVDSSLGVTTNTGLVKGSDIEKVKTYVDNVAQDLSIGITGDNYITATRGDNKNYTITADVTTLTLTTGGNSDSTLAGTADSLVDAADAASKVSDFVNARIGEEVAKLDSTTTATDTYFTMTVGEADGKLIDASTSARLTYGSMDGTNANNATGGIAKAEDVQDFVDTYNFWETYSASNNG